MSRTFRNIKKDKSIVKGGDAQVESWDHSNRLTPYTKKKNIGKYKATKSSFVGGYSKGVTRADKLDTKNANRSLKKAFRQELKNQLKQELNEY